jgi:hypothetical protein
MRRILLPVGMLLMGIALVGGAAETLVGSTLTPLDEQIGTHGSAAAAVLGIGLIFAAANPSAHIGWVRAGILYGFVVLLFEGGSYFLFRKTFHLGPVIFGLAFSLLLIAAYPERKKLIPSSAMPGRKPAVTPAPPEAAKPPATVSEKAPEKPV